MSKEELARKRNQLYYELQALALPVNETESLEGLRIAARLEEIIDQMPTNDDTIFGLGCRAAIAEIRGQWSAAIHRRSIQIEKLLLTVRVGTGLTLAKRQVLLRFDGEALDDTDDVYPAEHVVDEWRVLVYDLWKASRNREALDEICKIEEFCRVYEVDFDLDELREGVLENLGPP
jgi:hypothetical protein